MNILKKPFKLFSLPFSRGSLETDLLFLVLLVTPFLSIVDVMWMFSPKNFNEWVVINTPASIKILKDLLIIMLLFYLLSSIKRLNKVDLGILFFLFLINFYKTFQLLTLDLSSESLLGLIIAGNRWYIPLFFFPLFQNINFSKAEMINFLERYRILILVAIVLQLLQLAFSTRWGECAADGCRSSGFFAMPQPQAFFSLFFLFFSDFLKLKNDAFFRPLAYLSIIFTKSAAGIIGIFGFVFFKVPKKYRSLIVLFSLSVVIFFPFITGRTSYWNSPLIRLQLLMDMNFDNSYFGSYTNACINISSITSQVKMLCQPPDSFLISLLGNLNPILGIFIILIICYYIWKSRVYSLFIIFGLFLAGGSYTEYFPLCILFPLILGFKSASIQRMEIKN